jgi:streptomycin 6-kinase
MPRGLLEVAERDNRQAWMSMLPGLIRDLSVEWSLALRAPFQPGGETAWVAPVEGPSGEHLVLKVVWRHLEAEHEAEGLAVWAGRGAIRLHASKRFDDTLALLVERCTPGTELRSLPEPEQDIVIAGLLRRLWIQPSPGHHFRPLEHMCEHWADRFEEELAGRDLALDPGLVRAAIALFRELPTTAESEVLLCTDLHAGNVLAAEREPWLVIDPKPYLGDPTYDPLQHMLNCEQRLRADPRGLATRMAALLDLDRDRLLSWLFARSVQFSPTWPFLAEVARDIAPG